jgi:hypothetical protein
MPKPISLTAALIINLANLMPGHEAARLCKSAELVAECFEKVGDQKDLYHRLQQAVDKWFDGKSPDRKYFHTTATERIADIAMETLKKRGLSTSKTSYQWWEDWREIA